MNGTTPTTQDTPDKGEDHARGGELRTLDGIGCHDAEQRGIGDVDE